LANRNPGNRNGRENGQSETSIPKFLPNLIIVLERMESYHHLSLDHINQMVFQKLPETLSSITDKYSLDEKTRKELEESEIGSTPKSTRYNER
jgi:hypothetical protein